MRRTAKAAKSFKPFHWTRNFRTKHTFSVNYLNPIFSLISYHNVHLCWRWGLTGNSGSTPIVLTTSLGTAGNWIDWNRIGSEGTGSANSQLVLPSPSPSLSPRPPTHQPKLKRLSDELKIVVSVCNLLYQTGLVWLNLFHAGSSPERCWRRLRPQERGEWGKITLFLPGLALHLICLRFHRLIVYLSVVL